MAPPIHDSGSDSLSACAFSAGSAAAWANAFRSVVSSDAGSPAGAAKSSDRLLRVSASVTAAFWALDSDTVDSSSWRVGTPDSALL